MATASQVRRTFDASFASALVVPSQRNPTAEAVMREPLVELVAPSILRQEVHHLLLRAERRREWPVGESLRMVRAFRGLPIQYYHDEGWVERAYDLARVLGTGLFDTIYLVAAEDLEAELWTLDQRFLRALRGRYGDRVRTVPS